MVFLLVPVLLFAQGLRLCMHAHDDLMHATDHIHTASVHLESTVSSAVDHEESAADVDVPFAVLLKLFYSALAFALVSVLVFLAPATRLLARRLPPPAFWFHPSAAYSLTPPLRAPPR